MATPLQKQPDTRPESESRKDTPQALGEWARLAAEIRREAESRNLPFIALCAGALEQAAQSEKMHWYAHQEDVDVLD